MDDKYKKKRRDRFDESETSCDNKDDIDEVWKLVKLSVTNVAIEVCGVSKRKKEC